MCTDTCFCCGMNAHIVIDFPMTKTQGRESDHVQASAPCSDAPERNLFYALKCRGDKEGSPDVFTSMLKVFLINICTLLDRGATLSFLTPLLGMNFNVLPDVLVEPYSVSTL